MLHRLAGGGGVAEAGLDLAEAPPDVGGRGALVGRGQFKAAAQGSEAAFEIEAGFGGGAAELEEGKVVVGRAFEDAGEGGERAGQVILGALEVGAGKGALIGIAGGDGVGLFEGLAHAAAGDAGGGGVEFEQTLAEGEVVGFEFDGAFHGAAAAVGGAQGFEGGAGFAGEKTAGGAVFELKLGVVGPQVDGPLEVIDGELPFPALGGELAEVEQGDRVLRIGSEHGFEDRLGFGVAALVEQVATPREVGRSFGVQQDTARAPGEEADEEKAERTRHGRHCVEGGAVNQSKFNDWRDRPTRGLRVRGAAQLCGPGPRYWPPRSTSNLVAPLMKPVLLCLMSSLILSAASAGDMLKSGVWKWDELTVEAKPSGERRAILLGEGADASHISVHATTLNPGQKPHAPHQHDDLEEMIIVKEGRLTITIGEQTREVGPGSVAIALAGDMHGWTNHGNAPATYYVLQYKSRWGADAGGDPARRLGSRIIDAEDVAFAANPRGGYRGFFNGSTGTLRLFELHETTLMAGVQNHPVHTHAAEEMVIMLAGHVDLQINGVSHVGKPGDVFFVAANDPHTLFTHGVTPSRYFAFQWR